MCGLFVVRIIERSPPLVIHVGPRFLKRRATLKLVLSMLALAHSRAARLQAAQRALLPKAPRTTPSLSRPSRPRAPSQSLLTSRSTTKILVRACVAVEKQKKRDPRFVCVASSTHVVCTTDFSDSVTTKITTSSLVLTRTEYEVVNNEIRRAGETPQQKLERLQFEVKEFLEELQSNKNAESSNQVRCCATFVSTHVYNVCFCFSNK